MNRVMRSVAVVVLLITVIGAGAVLYGVKMMAPQIVSATATATSATQVQEAFDMIMEQVADGRFTGHVFADAGALTAEQCAFMTYSVRLANRGFFPAEWIALSVSPRMDAQNGNCDVLQLDDAGAYVLAAGAQGDMSTTVLTTLAPEDTRGVLEVSCYVFGRKITIPVQIQ